MLFKRILKGVAYSILVILILIAAILMVFYSKDKPLVQLLEKYTDESSYFLKVDDINVHVRVKGEGEPIFLIHGSFASLHTWTAWEEDLSPYFMTISMDLPGHGLTGPDALQRYGIADYASLVLRIADQLGIEEFHIAGNSMGGAVALKMASDHPERILTLNLVDAAGAPSTPRPAETSESKPAVKNERNSSFSIFSLVKHPIFGKMITKFTPKFLFKMNLKQVFGDESKITDEMVARYYDMMLREGNRQATLERLTTRKPYDIEWDNITMPVLIMWGALDSWIPLRAGEAMHAKLPQSTLKVYPSAGHVPMEEIPTETVIDYLSFLGIQLDTDYLNSPKYFSHVP
ncbi:alpha/beta hydrolase [Mongoliitalea daihaiensis]|nr:alpha/beta hydrolase [Mongoliitalea daihaiensis]